MSDPGLMSLVVIPIAFGLIGFVEPCSIGATLLFIKFVEGASRAAQLMQVTLFALTRALFIGLLGVVAALIGSQFFILQKAAWVVLGSLFVVIGALVAAGRTGSLMATIGPGLGTVSSARGSIALGLLFGVNIPACAVPILALLLGAAATHGATGGTLAQSFGSLALFGLALSLPLVVAVLFERSRRLLDWLAGLSARLPIWTGLLLIALGIWSIWFGLFARIGV